jgi:hypothetical protein
VRIIDVIAVQVSHRSWRKQPDSETLGIEPAANPQGLVYAALINEKKNL